MKTYSRLYSGLLKEHFADNRQMAFVSGPRQVGKTTMCTELGSSYLNWDDQDAREIILGGPKNVADFLGLDKISDEKKIIVFDELHRYSKWKTFLKGFFDVYGKSVHVIVTGSSRLDVFKRGGDSLMGRYFLYRMHPLSVAECLSPELTLQNYKLPVELNESEWNALWKFGGFPEPFVRRSDRFSRRWHSLRHNQLLREDVRVMTRIQELEQLDTMALILERRSAEQLVYSNLAREVRVSENTVRAWISTLSSLHFGFLVKPWFRNVSKAIRKEPKWFLRDWSIIEDEGQRVETFIACHLLKAVEGWTDLGMGKFELFYIRDKQKREVDFLVTRDAVPWFIVESKKSDTSLSSALDIMQKQTGALHAFQVVFEEDFVDADCFKYVQPVVVPARTLLSQLL